MKLSVVSLCALLSAIPASMALPEPGASLYEATFNSKTTGSNCHRVVPKADDKDGKCSFRPERAMSTKILLECYTSIDTTVVNNNPGWGKVPEKREDGRPYEPALDSTGKVIEGGIWYPLGNMTVGEGLPNCG